MAIKYVVKQDKNPNRSGYWYGRAVHDQHIHLDQVADRIQRNCSLKKADVLGVLTEMVEVMRDELQNSNIVYLDNFGYFKVGIRSAGSITEESYNTLDNVKGFRVNFTPVGRRQANGTITRTFLENVRAEKAETVPA